MRFLKSGRIDPRSTLDEDELAQANAAAMPPVGSGSGFSPGLGLGLGAIALLGLVTFMSLRSQRGPEPQPVATPTPTPTPSPVFTPPPPAPVQVPVTVVPPPAPAPTPAATEPPPGWRSPAMVIDLSKAAPPTPAQAAADRPGTGATAEDQFADRVAAAENKPARAIPMINGDDIVPQGAIIPGVLETAINSDLPGYVRAIVSRDVKSFDASKVLIPRGSRLIGQYKSGLQTGQTRTFVIWSRLVRPDGVSVSLGSPSTDSLGQAGLTGEVDNHFLKRFGSAILLSLFQAGIESQLDSDSSVVVSTAQGAQGVAGVALQGNINIPPTIKVPTGTPIIIFTARDLDFSGVNQAAKK